MGKLPTEETDGRTFYARSHVPKRLTAADTAA